MHEQGMVGRCCYGVVSRRLAMVIAPSAVTFVTCYRTGLSLTTREWTREDFSLSEAIGNTMPTKLFRCTRFHPLQATNLKPMVSASNRLIY